MDALLFEGCQFWRVRWIGRYCCPKRDLYFNRICDTVKTFLKLSGFGVAPSYCSARDRPSQSPNQRRVFNISMRSVGEPSGSRCSRSVGACPPCCPSSRGGFLGRRTYMSIATRVGPFSRAFGVWAAIDIQVPRPKRRFFIVVRRSVSREHWIARTLARETRSDARVETCEGPALQRTKMWYR